MASRELIDSQFDRAVQVVQGLPKTGPIQTDYEEKLEMYSLYKQATVGNVKSARPGIFDMLGRAKWDAWAKHSSLDSYEAKWLYVEALLKVLRKYSDKTIARDLVKELESYAGDPSNLIMNGSLAQSLSETTGSTASDDDEDSGAQPYNAFRDLRKSTENEAGFGPEEEEGDDETRNLPPSRFPKRPQSSLSSHRYRTPLAGSLLTSPPPDMHPHIQPHPEFETSSVFAPPHLGYPNSPASHLPRSIDPHRREPTSPLDIRPPSLSYRGQYGHDRPKSRPMLETAIENMQSHIAALTERIESLENRAVSRSHTSGSPRARWFAARGSVVEDLDASRWDTNDLGLWSMILNPLSRGIVRVCDWGVFFARNENRSPAKLIVRRLVLDVSFLVFVVAILGAIWRRSGVRRKEVRAALVVLWKALLGSSARSHRTVADKTV